MIKTEIYDRINAERETALRNERAAAYHRSHILTKLRKGIATAFLTLVIIAGIGFVGEMDFQTEVDLGHIQGYAKETETTYPTTGIVTTVTQTYIIFTDFNGNEWKINGDPEDWVCGDRIAVIMSDKGTPEIYDDEVLSTRYCGWVY